MTGFVGINGSAGRYGTGDGDDRSIFGLEHERKRAALTFAHDNDHAALASLVLRKATINAISPLVSRAHMAAEVCAVHLDLTGNGRALGFGGQCFADFVSHDESRLILAIQVPAQLQGAMTLRAVHENGDGQKIVADRKLAAGENGPAGNAELVRASLALEQLAGRVGVDSGAFAARANRLAVSGSPPDKLEGLVGFLVRQTGD